MRQLRADFAGALHHVYSRGIDGRDIFRDDRDRLFFLDWLGQIVEKVGWIVHVYTGGLPRMLAAYLAVREGLVRLRDVAASLTLRSSGHISDLVRRCARAIGQQRDVAAKAEACLARLRSVSLALSCG